MGNRGRTDRALQLLGPVFRIDDDTGLGDLLEIYVEAEHPFGLPGVTCPTCSAVWATTAIDYPSLDPEPLRKLIALDAANVPWDEYLRRLEVIRPHVPAATLLRPGTTIGPLVGKAKGRYVDFAFAGLWNLLVSPDALQRLTQAGVTGLRSASTDIAMRGQPFPYLELEAHPHLRVAPESIPEGTPPPCPTCGRWPIKPIKPTAFQAGSVPHGEDLFRGYEMTTWLFASCRFVEAARALGLRGATFTEVKLV